MFFKKIEEFIHIIHNHDDYKALIIHEGKEIIVTNSEHLFDISPFTYGFYFDEFFINLKKRQVIKLQYFKNNVLIATNLISFLYETNNLYLFNIKKTTLSPFNNLKLFLNYHVRYCKKLGKTETTFSEQKTIASIYSLPRKVYICSFTSLQGKNILFPIDLVIQNNNLIFFSIRKTNTTVKEIIKKKKSTLIYSKFTSKENILKLGKYHSVAFPELSKLGFKTKKSQLFKHPIPEFLDHYIEIENLETLDLYNQTLFIGRVLFEKPPLENYETLANIYFLFKKNIKTHH